MGMARNAFVIGAAAGLISLAGKGAVPEVAHLLSAGGGNGNVALGQRLAAKKYGWTGSQWNCLYTLWQGESGWSQYSDTRASGLDPAGAPVFAYGIPQARGHGSDIGGVTAPYPPAYAAGNPASLGGSSDPRTQVLWGLRYIASTYGSPCAALSYKQSTGNQGY